MTNNPGDGADQTGRRPNNRSNPLGDLPDRILEALRASPAGELEHHVKAMVAQAADRMDLVPREEFEIQKAMVDRLRERVESLERALAAQNNSEKP